MRRPRHRRYHRRFRRDRCGRAGPPAGTRRTGAGGGCGPGRPQLPGYRRQHDRAVSRLGHLRARQCRAAEPERQSGPRTPAPHGAARPRLLPVRLARQPGRGHPRRPGRGLREARAHLGDRCVRRGLRRRACLRRGGRGGGQAGRSAHRGPRQRLRAQRPVPHRGAHHILRCRGRRVPGQPAWNWWPHHGR